MQINNEILKNFIICHYKAYRKSKHQTGTITDYQILCNELRQKAKENFERIISKDPNFICINSNFDNITSKEGISLNLKFANENIDLTLDGIEFADKKNITPIFITPFEKVTIADKLFVALQGTFIQNEFKLQIVNFKIVYGTNSRQTKFKLSSFTKSIKKQTGELNKILSNSNAPVFFKNNHCQICEFQNNCFEKLIERDDLSLLTALKPKEIVQKNNRGIFSVKQLSYTFRPKKITYLQKCLLHLIRDINEDLLKNQLNQEFMNFAVEFGHLLRNILEKVNKYGLKKRNLSKHRKEVQDYFSKLSITGFDTELAICYQKRILKNKDKLFTFMDYDGIPWNNNNAENAVKVFSYYRKLTKNRLKENGMSDYLVLLSILQTCKYRGLNFFEFLKSGKLSIFEFQEKLNE